jgi:hypothetical protein
MSETRELVEGDSTDLIVRSPGLWSSCFLLLEHTINRSGEWNKADKLPWSLTCQDSSLEIQLEMFHLGKRGG